MFHAWKSMISIDMTLLWVSWLHKIKISPWTEVETENKTYWRVANIIQAINVANL